MNLYGYVGGKQWQTTPKYLPRMQRTRAIPVAWLNSGLCPDRPKGWIPIPPTKPCALRSTQPLKVSTRDFSWGKGGRCVWLTTYHPRSAEISRNPGPWSTRYPLGHLGLSREIFTFLIILPFKATHILSKFLRGSWTKPLINKTQTDKHDHPILCALYL